MSFTSKFGYLVRQHLGNNVTSAGPVTSLLKFNLMRCMATKLFVGGLSFGTDDQTLRDAFTSFGEVTEARVITDRDTGRSRGFGFVNFTTDESANEALSNMDGKELHGRHIRVSIANERAGGGGGFQGRFSGGGSFVRDPSS